MLLSGGPGKDGIPAITNPQFVNISDANLPDSIRGILIEAGGEKRYYPYNILVWHEIINDQIDGVAIAVTFCPLCGSAIVFDRKVKRVALEFRVSGLLYESNLVMYDTATESLWSQAKNEAVVGFYTGTKLNIFPVQELQFSNIRANHPQAKILSENTGYHRDYHLNPYAGYENTEALMFPVSVQDKRYPAKEIMYVIPYKEKSIAFPQIRLKEGSTQIFSILDNTLIAQKSNSEISVKANGKILPDYYEMWFSWATHHQEDGVVWELSD